MTCLKEIEIIRAQVTSYFYKIRIIELKDYDLFGGKSTFKHINLECRYSNLPSLLTLYKNMNKLNNYIVHALLNEESNKR